MGTPVPLGSAFESLLLVNYGIFVIIVQRKEVRGWWNSRYSVEKKDSTED